MTLPLPRARPRHDGRRLTLSYANLYIANGGVVVPSFEDPADPVAFKAVAAAFPDRQAIQVDAVDIAHGGGGIHCITLQEPAP
jgi:agmatine deiminase